MFSHKIRATIIAVCLAVVGIVLPLVLTSGSAVAGQTTGFAPAAKSGIIQQFNRIYGYGNAPYYVKCYDTPTVPFPVNGGRVDTVTCNIYLKN